MSRCKLGRHAPRMQDGVTPLHLAKTVELVDALVKAKADVNLGNMVMYICACVSRGRGSEVEGVRYGWGKGGCR